MKIFVIIFEGLSLKQIKQILLEGESPTLKHHSKTEPKSLNKKLSDNCLKNCGKKPAFE